MCLPFRNVTQSYFLPFLHPSSTQTLLSVSLWTPYKWVIPYGQVTEVKKIFRIFFQWTPLVTSVPVAFPPLLSPPLTLVDKVPFVLFLDSSMYVSTNNSSRLNSTRRVYVFLFVDLTGIPSPDVPPIIPSCFLFPLSCTTDFY